jgi:WD40 repeat protein
MQNLRQTFTRLSPIFFLIVISLLFFLVILMDFCGNRVSAAGAPAVDQPVLRIGGEDHTGFILGLAVSVSGNMVVTGSFDGTLRTWSMPDLKPIGEPIHLPVGNPVHTAAGAGNRGDDVQGAVYAIALSPDAKTLVATGWTGGWETGNPPWCFYVIDLDVREIRRKPVCDLPRKVNHATFSVSGEYLAFALKPSPTEYTGGGVRVYRTSDYTLVGADSNYANASNWVEFDHAGRMVTSSMDGKIRVYDADLEKSHLLRPRIEKEMPEHRKVDGLAISPDGTKIAVGYFESEGDDQFWAPRLDILSSADLSFLPQPDLRGIDNGVLWRAAWSPDGAFLYAGGTWRKGSNYMIRRWADSGGGKYFDYSAATSKIIRMATAASGQIVFAAEVPALGLVGPGDKMTLRKSAVDDFHDIGGALGVSSDGFEVEFASGGQVAHFSLLMRVLETGNASDSLAMSHAITDDPNLDVRDWENGYKPTLRRLVPFPQDSIAARPLEQLQPHEQSLSLTYLPESKGLILGTIWFVRRYDADGKLLWYTRVPSAHGVAVTPDNRLLVAALGDGTIRWFDMSTGDQLLSLFPHADGQRWAAWTPKGYYVASVGGDTLVGWQVNRGHEQVGDFFPVGNFEEQYLRPDIVTKSIALLSEQKAIEEAARESGRAPASDIVQMLPPVINIQTINDLVVANGATIDNPQVVLHFQVRTPSGQPITMIEASVAGNLLINPQLPTIDSSGQAAGDFAVLVPPHDSFLALYAENEFGRSVPATVAFKWHGAPISQEETPRKIYVLAVGITDFDDEHFPHLTYPGKDAGDFLHAIQGQIGKAFTDVVVYDGKPLAGANIKLGDIRQGLAWLDKETQPGDLGVLFLAGHGFNDRDGTYYYVPSGGNLDDPKNTALSGEEILRALNGIKGYPVLFIDTCHAANVAGHPLSIDLDGTVNRLKKQPRGVIVYAAAAGEKSSLESPIWQNGAFTHVLVQGMVGGAQYEKDRDLITASMLQTYLIEHVPDLTGGMQTAMVGMPLTAPNLVLARTSK